MAEKGKSKDTDNAGENTTSSSQDDKEVNLLQQLLQRFGFSSETLQDETEKEKPEQLLEEITFEGVAKFIKTEKCKNIIVMTGAGVSTAAGIPDFRSPGTGLYDNLQKYDLPSPQSVFDIHYFKHNPEPFFKLAKELYPGSFKPTVSHYFVKLLEEKELLLRIYTQNIDTLERIAEISSDRIVEAHGTFHLAHCLDCRVQYTQQFVKDEVFQDRIPKCIQCGGVVKPDIVFFGESLPQRFSQLVDQDMSKCDLLIVMGTSLVVQPFASLVSRVPETTPRLLINREKAGVRGDMMSLLYGDDGFHFDQENNYRDVFWSGNADDGCLELADLLGWKDELLAMIKEGHQIIDDENKADEKEAKTNVADNNTVKTSETKPTDKAEVKEGHQIIGDENKTDEKEAKTNVADNNTVKTSETKPTDRAEVKEGHQSIGDENKTDETEAKTKAADNNTEKGLLWAGASPKIA